MKITMKNNSYIFFIMLLISCSSKNKHLEKKEIADTLKASYVKNELFRKSSAELKIDTFHNEILYIMNIKNKNCIVVDTILQIPKHETNFHTLELLKPENILFYEYESVRPVFYQKIFFDEQYNLINSIEEGSFIFKKLDYKTNIDNTKIDICNTKISNLIKK